MADLATAGDVEARWRSLTAEEYRVANILIGDASGIVRVRVPSVDARIADGSLDPDVVRGVVARMVLRVMRNPDGKVQESIDDYAYRRADAVADGALYLSDEERSVISPARGTGGAFTIRPYGAPGYSTNLPLNWWELNL